MSGLLKLGAFDPPDKKVNFGKFLEKASAPFAKGDTKNFYIFGDIALQMWRFSPKFSLFYHSDKSLFGSFSTEKEQYFPVLFCELHFLQKKNKTFHLLTEGYCYTK